MASMALSDTSGKAITPTKYDYYSGYFQEGFTAVKAKCKWGFMDKTGKEITPLKYDYAVAFNEVWLKLAKKKWGFIDTTGKEVIPLKYDEAMPFKDGLAKVKRNGKSGKIDKTGKEFFD